MLIYRSKTLKLEIISGQLVQDGTSFGCWKKRPELSFPYFETQNKLHSANPVVIN